MKKYCLNLKSFLKHDVYYDIDGLDLLLIIVLKEVMQIDENNPINVLNYLKRLNSFLIGQKCIDPFSKLIN